MRSKEYIISKLKSFINDFSHARVRYEFDSDIDTHFIEIVPSELYNLDKDYMDWEENMFDDFIEKFPGESICFITEDALVGIDNVLFEMHGKQFELLYTTSKENLSVCDEFMEITSSISSDFNEYFSEKNSSVHVVETSNSTTIKPNDTILLAA